MGRCPRCGAQLESGTAACPACGAEAASPEKTVHWQKPAQIRTAERRRPTLSPGRRIALVLVAVLFLAGAAFLGWRAVRENRPGVHGRPGTAAASDESASDTGREGLYRLSAYSLADGSSAAGEDWYLIFNGDGSGTACLLGRPARRFSCTASRLVFADGSYLDYTAEGDLVTIRSGATLVFVRSDESASARADPGAIPLNCRWTGVLEISGHKGGGTLSDGKMDVWGATGETESGRLYFELYSSPDRTEETRPILSMWVEPDGDRLVPVIGEKDAWFFDIWLLPSDEEALSLRYADGRLRCSYRYAVEDERCTISFRLSPEPG